jgi:hypothetical protein
MILLTVCISPIFASHDSSDDAQLERYNSIYHKSLKNSSVLGNAIQRFESKYGDIYRGDMDINGHVRTLHGYFKTGKNIKEKDVKGAKNFAYSFLKENNDGLFNFNFSNLKYAGISEDRKSFSVNYQQHFRGIPIHNAMVSISFKKDGTVRAIGNNYQYDVSVQTEPRVTKELAVVIANSSYNFSFPQYDIQTIYNRTHLVILPQKSGRTMNYHLAWFVPLPLETFYVDAHDGLILQKSTNIVAEDISGTITATVYNDILASADDTKTVPLKRQRIWINNGFSWNLETRTDSSGYYSKTVSSPVQLGVSLKIDRFTSDPPEAWYDAVSVVNAPAESFSRYHTYTYGDLTHSYQYSDDGGFQPNIYYHINRGYDYFVNEFAHYNNFVTAHANMDPLDPPNENVQSWTDHNNGVDLYFISGAYGDYAKSSDVILHEFTHSVIYDAKNHWIYTGGDWANNSAVDEGLPTYFPCSINDDPIYGEIVSRNVDISSSNATNVVRDFNGDGSVDELDHKHKWNRFPVAGSLWKIREVKGQAFTDDLIWHALTYLQDGYYTPNQYYNALLEEDDDPSRGGNSDPSDGTPNCNLIKQAFAAHGMDYTTTCPPPPPAPGTIDDFANEEGVSQTNNGYSWGDWTYYESDNTINLWVDGTSNGYSGSGGMFKIGDQAVDGSDWLYIKRPWSIDTDSGKISFYYMNTGPNAYIRLRLEDSNGRKVSTSLVGLGSSSWKLKDESLKSFSDYLPGDDDVNFDWKNVRYIYIYGYPYRWGTGDTDFYFDELKYTPSVPDAPTGLTIPDYGYNYVDLNWNDNERSDDVDTYKIYRGGTYLTSTTTSQYHDPSVNPGTEYCYEVSAVNGEGESLFSNDVCVTTHNTGTGSDISVDLGSGNSVNFATVTASGDTQDSVSSTNQWGIIPSDYLEISNYHDITTTASYSGSVITTLAYTESLVNNESNLDILHWTGSDWEIITSSIDKANNKVSGTTNTLSPFVIVEKEDLYPPVISIFSPENVTYGTTSIDLNYSVSDASGVDWIGYSLDGGANVTLTGNITLAGLSAGPHNVVIYANDTFGNLNSSMVWFTVQPEVPLTLHVFFYDEEYHAGETLMADVVVANWGGVPATDTVNLTVIAPDGSVVNQSAFQVTVDPLDARIIRFEYPLPQDALPGYWRLKARFTGTEGVPGYKWFKVTQEV